MQRGQERYPWTGVRSRIFQTQLMARLIFGTPQGERAVELQLVNGLGRHPANALQLMDKIASKEHAVVELRGSSYVLRDLGSLNGTYVNGERVSGERYLRHGDEIEIGM